MLPAVAQGAIGVSCRSDDAQTRELLQSLNDDSTATAVACERAFLGELDGSCRTPIAGLAELRDNIIRFRGEILTPDGKQCLATERSGPAETALRLGEDAATELLDRAGPDFLRVLA